MPDITFVLGLLCLAVYGHGVDYAVIWDMQGGCSRSTVGRAATSFVKFLIAKAPRYIVFPKVKVQLC